MLVNLFIFIFISFWFLKLDYRCIEHTYTSTHDSNQSNWNAIAIQLKIEFHRLWIKNWRDSTYFQSEIQFNRNCDAILKAFSCKKKQQQQKITHTCTNYIILQTFIKMLVVSQFNRAFDLAIYSTCNTAIQNYTQSAFNYRFGDH